MHISPSDNSLIFKLADTTVKLVSKIVSDIDELYMLIYLERLKMYLLFYL